MLNIGSKVYRNLTEQVAENMKQIGKIWEKLDGLDVYDNVIVLATLDPLTPEELDILAKPVSFIVYNNDVYMKRGASSSQLFFDKVYAVDETAGTIIFSSGEITVTYPIGTVTLTSATNETYTTAQIDTLLSAKLDISAILDTIFPIGHIYMSVDGTSPASLFGGTWEALEAQFLLGAGSGYTAGATGGEETHTLTVGEIPSHRHDQGGWIYAPNLETQGNTVQVQMQEVWTGRTVYTGYSGSGYAHNNMPPYLVVYMWKRTA